MTNPDVYPITADFEKKVSELNLKEVGKLVARQMQTHLGEYEHGVAEPEVLFPEGVMKCLKGYGISNEREDSAIEGKNFTDLALETMSAMFLDFLMTYWVVGINTNDEVKPSEG